MAAGRAAEVWCCSWQHMLQQGEVYVCAWAPLLRESSLCCSVSERQGFSCIFKDLLYGFDTIYSGHQVHHQVSLLPSNWAGEFPAHQCTGSGSPVAVPLGCSWV